ncbi:MAG TPA: lysine-2,3-aminomutase-like protein [Stellaceae bacterium]|nr:lysine-2,3-aminomutase-like protein [Stellaceae bacterium]
MTLCAEDMVDRGLAAARRLDEIQRVAERFSVAVTEDMAALIDPADPADPIAAQFVPSAAELETAPEELADPIGDHRWSPVPGIVHRYPDRVLLKPTLLCPVYCRFCFRREAVGKAPAMLDEAALERAFAYIRERPEIWEVIVTGGDPLVLTPRRIAAIVRVLDRIAHLGVIRFHTRVPVVDSSRVTPALVAALTAEKAVYVVVHANHPRELTAAAKAAVTRLVRAGIPVLSQTVLLHGVNDDAAVLEALFRGLVAMRVKPYYLHHADLARGTAHFRTGIAAGQRLVRALRGRVSGLCQPIYVLDIPGGHGKVPLALSAAAADEASGGWTVEDGAGGRHLYPPDPADVEE